MKAEELYRQLHLFTRLTDKRATAANYRALVLGTDHVRASGLFGLMECDVALGLGSEACIDCDDFSQLLRSLPDAEFEPQLSNGALRWTCGAAKGHLSLLTGDMHEPLEVPAPRFGGNPPEGAVDAEFGAGLELGALSCGPEGLRAVGLQGVQISNSDGRAYARATDNATLSSCCLGPAVEGPLTRPGTSAPTITLLPEAVDLLAALIQRDGGAVLTYDTSSVYCVTNQARLLLHQVPPLRIDIAAILRDYTAAEVKMPLRRAAVAAFLRRAEALSESPSRATVEISVEEGRTSLMFNEATSSSEEYYLVDGGPQITVPPVRIATQQLAKALAHADDIIFDFAARNVLILRGSQEFMFAITGRRERTE